MRIELWGTYPPPIGGVSIHIYRLIHYLHEKDDSIILRNFGKTLPPFTYIKPLNNFWVEFVKLLFGARRVIHLHSNNVLAFFLFILFGFRHKVGVTIHNKNLIKETSFVKKKVIKRFLRSSAFIILNDQDYKDKLIESFQCESKHIFILPAFFPPMKMEYKGLSADIHNFRNNHAFVLSANAYKLRLENNIDVYGLDLLIRLVKELKDEKVDVGLIFCLPAIGDVEYYNRCLSKIVDWGLENNILIVQKELSNGFEVWKLSDLFIRPTSTDIEGISVKEALFCGTLAIASDVCVRPKEAILFGNRNFEDLKQKVWDCYMNRNILVKDKIYISDNTVDEILNIYKSVM